MLRIKNWEELYETSETRKYKYLRWFPVPNKFDGKGFKRLSRHEFAPAIYAAWVHMLAFASKPSRELRGNLVDSDGPLSTEDMADKTGFPEDMYRMAIPVLLDPRIGWLEEVDEQGNPVKKDDLPESAGVTEDNSRLQQDEEDPDPDNDQGDYRQPKTSEKEQSAVVTGESAGATEDNIPELNRRNEQKGISTTAQTQAPAPVPMVKYLQEVKTWVVAMRKANLASWQRAYPAVDIHRELAAAGLWLVNNADTKKKKKFGRFFQNWCKGEQEKGGPRGRRTGNFREDQARADQELMAELESRIRAVAKAGPGNKLVTKIS